MKPILNRVTITGADDSIDPKDLKRLQEEFPFVEWGILVSQHKTAENDGAPRFPSSAWLRELCGAPRTLHEKELGQTAKLNLSAHICGRWVRQICKGEWHWLAGSGPVTALIYMARRVQLNFGRIPVMHDSMAADLQVYLPATQVILQTNADDDHVVSNLYDDGCDVAALYDSSGGAGELPEEWPLPTAWEIPLVGIPCGYAGGLSPENVEEQLELLSAFVKDAIWIDTETRVRSEDDQKFDLDLVHAFLEKTAPWVIK